jgi:UDP-N-acetylmuramoyl-L-alanyl-D-glutamate--2,6-diaminopimelate ligase
MIQLKDILYKAGIIDVIGSTEIEITTVTANSNEVKNGGMFVARKGVLVDSHRFIPDAVDKGAVAIVCEEFPDAIRQGVSYIKVSDSTMALGFIASNYFDNPSDKVTLVGITGTNGKTTTASLLFQLFRNLGYSCGLISTVDIRINEQVLPSTHTTPDALRLNAVLSMMEREGCEYCFMEVSSHAVDQNRIAGLKFKIGAFTNITHDHLDYHKTFDAYLKAKQKFFDILPSDAFAVYNIDDKNGQVIVQGTKAAKKSFALKSMADYKCKVIENNIDGLFLVIEGYEVSCKLIGTFNAYNILTVYVVAVLLGEDPVNVLTVISNLNPVEGRFQYTLSKNKVMGIIDFAHTPDALKNVLNTINNIRKGNEQVITVVGCGGDRDVQKRPVMARISAELSDKVILTSDNPRSEDPEKIIDEMNRGVEPVNSKKVLAIPNRKEAIKAACSMADPGDIILVAGKGHEKYQDIGGTKHPFDDLQVLQDSFKIYES